jgi:putative DNA primase/helicase
MSRSGENGSIGAALENTLKGFDLARGVAREFAIACSNTNDSIKIASATKVAAIERLARSDRRHASTTEKWDADHWVINATSATLDLRTGLANPHCSTDYLTKITAVAADRDYPTPLWAKFLNCATADNQDLPAYLQRVVDYCLIGTTSEHALFFLYGTGANGKGLFLNTPTAIWNDYATVVPMETFIAPGLWLPKKPSKADVGQRAKSRP